MVAAGLTAATPHMISASINALSRLLFEFKGKSINLNLSYFSHLTLFFPSIPIPPLLGHSYTAQDLLACSSTLNTSLITPITHAWCLRTAHYRSRARH
jgi:hypothetical protein